MFKTALASGVPDRMCRYRVLKTDLASRRFGVIDSYGKVHLAKSAASVPAAGGQLHGPLPMMGFRFLVAEGTGYRYSCSFVQVNITEQELIDGLQERAPVHRARHRCTDVPPRGARSEEGDPAIAQAAVAPDALAHESIGHRADPNRHLQLTVFGPEAR